MLQRKQLQHLYTASMPISDARNEPFVAFAEFVLLYDKLTIFISGITG